MLCARWGGKFTKLCVLREARRRQQGVRALEGECDGLSANMIVGDSASATSAANEAQLQTRFPWRFAGRRGGAGSAGSAGSSCEDECLARRDIHFTKSRYQD